MAQRPARWHPAGLSHTLEALFDDGELFVHHEDLRRGDGTPQPRELTLADEQSLWRSLKGAARLALRKSPVTVVAEAPGRPRTVLKSAKDREVVVRGSVGEILLTVFGRRRAAAVDLLGSVGDVQAFEANLRGL